MKKLLICTAIAASALVANVGVASAGSFTTGCAANMVNTHRVPGGMETAMTVDNPNGNGDQSDPNATGGMWGAIYASCL